MKYLARFVAYALFMAVIGMLSVWPRYVLLDPQQAVVSVTFSHAGQRIGECRRLSQEELEQLPPNMRKPDKCPRARQPLFVQLRMDQELLYETLLQPSGLWRDGKADMYKRIHIDAGNHTFLVSMRDSGRETGFDYAREIELSISPGQNLVIGFDGLNGQFIIE